MKRIVLFDGDCNLCNHSVQWIIKRDPEAKFAFASLQSHVGRQWITTYALNESLKSFVLIENGRSYVKSDAALRVAKQLKGIWKLASIGLIIPRRLRDGVYDFIANRRYKWFGKRDYCLLSTPELRQRFLE